MQASALFLASISAWRLVKSYHENRLYWLVEINLDGVLHGCSLFEEKQGRHQEGGAGGAGGLVINIASCAGLTRSNKHTAWVRHLRTVQYTIISPVSGWLTGSPNTPWSPWPGHLATPPWPRRLEWSTWLCVLGLQRLVSSIPTPGRRWWRGVPSSLSLYRKSVRLWSSRLRNKSELLGVFCLDVLLKGRAPWSACSPTLLSSTTQTPWCCRSELSSLVPSGTKQCSLAGRVGLPPLQDCRDVWSEDGQHRPAVRGVAGGVLLVHLLLPSLPQLRRILTSLGEFYFDVIFLIRSLVNIIHFKILHDIQYKIIIPQFFLWLEHLITRYKFHCNVLVQCTTSWLCPLSVAQSDGDRYTEQVESTPNCTRCEKIKKNRNLKHLINSNRRQRDAPI